MKAHSLEHPPSPKKEFSKRTGKQIIWKLIHCAASIDCDTRLHHVTLLSVTVANCLRWESKKHSIVCVWEQPVQSFLLTCLWHIYKSREMEEEVLFIRQRVWGCLWSEGVTSGGEYMLLMTTSSRSCTKTGQICSGCMCASISGFHTRTSLLSWVKPPLILKHWKTAETASSSRRQRLLFLNYWRL